MARKNRERLREIPLTEAEKAEKLKAIKKAEKKAANKKKKVAKKAALLAILEFVTEQEDHGLEAEIALVTPGQRGGGGGSSVMDTFKDLFTANTEVKGLRLYQDYGMGQGEMRKIVRNLIKKTEPAKRIWVHYDKPSDTYTVMGRGAGAPVGWTGYRPVEVDDVEIV